MTKRDELIISILEGIVEDLDEVSRKSLGQPNWNLESVKEQLRELRSCCQSERVEGSDENY